VKGHIGRGDLLQPGRCSSEYLAAIPLDYEVLIGYFYNRGMEVRDFMAGAREDGQAVAHSLSHSAQDPFDLPDS
jgi:hypothetical protein